MPYNIYKLVHLLGIFTVITAVAAAGMHVLRGGAKADNPHRKALALWHGVGLFLILLGGFGMLARLGVMHGALPAWVFVKLAIWVVAGAALAFVYRGVSLARLLLFIVPLLGVLGGAVALYKP